MLSASEGVVCGAWTDETLLETRAQVRMPRYVDVSITDRGVVSKALDLAAVLAPTASVPVRHIHGVKHRPSVMVMLFVPPKTEEHINHRGRISVFDVEFAAEQACDVDAVGLVVPLLMIAGDNADGLVCNLCENLHALCQFLHRGKRFAIAIRDGTLDGTVHQIPVENRKHIRRIPDVRDVIHDALVVATGICPMGVCYRIKDEFFEIALNRSFDYNHSVTIIYCPAPTM